jgi:hypothetical protein
MSLLRSLAWRAFLALAAYPHRPFLGVAAGECAALLLGILLFTRRRRRRLLWLLR